MTVSCRTRLMQTCGKTRRLDAPLVSSSVGVLGACRQATSRLAKNIVDCLTQYREDRDGSQSQENEQESILYQILSGFILQKVVQYTFREPKHDLILLMIMTAFASIGGEPIMTFGLWIDSNRPNNEVFLTGGVLSVNSINASKFPLSAPRTPQVPS